MFERLKKILQAPPGLCFPFSTVDLALSVQLRPSAEFSINLFL